MIAATYLGRFDSGGRNGALAGGAYPAGTGGQVVFEQQQEWNRTLCFYPVDTALDEPVWLGEQDQVYLESVMPPCSIGTLSTTAGDKQR